jgi:hypothetical protein
MRRLPAAPLVALLALSLVGLSPLAGSSTAGAEQAGGLPGQAGAALTGAPAVPVGTPVRGDIPVVGDWDGDGTTTVGVQRGATFYLRNENTTGQADVTFDYGVWGDSPLAGDWDGDGTTTIGVRRGATFYLRNENSTGQADVSFDFGLPGDLPVVGDWDGNGTTTIGVYRDGTFYLRNENSTGPADEVVTFGIGGDQPVVGDWDGNGTTTVGVRRASTATFYWRNSNSTGVAEGSLTFGFVDDVGLAGDWDGNNTTTVGVRRGATFYLSDDLVSGAAQLTFDYGLLTVVTTGRPMDPGDYATAAFDAWRAGDRATLTDLAQDSASALLTDRQAGAGFAWSGPACQGAAGSSFCTWSAAEAQLTLQVGNEAASYGAARAVNGVRFDSPAGGVALWPLTTADEAANTQQQVDQGHSPWMLDPAAVADSYLRAELAYTQPTVTPLSNGDLQARDAASGHAVSLHLVQPARAGQGGIWVVARVVSSS